MERKIGETFEYEGKTYKAIEITSATCGDCELKEHCSATNVRNVFGECLKVLRTDKKEVVFVEVKPEEKHDAVEEVLRLMPSEKTEISSDLYKRLVYLGIIDPTGVRGSNVGNSNYSQHTIQAWSLWLDYPELTPWDDDIIKRILRTKEEAGMTATEARIMDYNKIIHICKERIRQLELGK